LLVLADGGGCNKMKCSCSGYERLLELASVCSEEDAPSEKEVYKGVPEAKNGRNINYFGELTEDKLFEKFVPYFQPV
jgi:hypothetical protein